MMLLTTSRQISRGESLSIGGFYPLRREFFKAWDLVCCGWGGSEGGAIGYVLGFWLEVQKNPAALSGAGF